MEATFKESYYIKNGKFQLKCLVYEYRGNTYEVFIGDTQDTLWEQHKMQQSYIDRQIEIEERIEERPKHHESDAFEDFKFFWDYVNDKVDCDGNRI